MAIKFGRAAAQASPAVESKILPPDKSTEQLVEQHSRINEADLAAQEALLDSRLEPEYFPLPEVCEETSSQMSPASKLSKLVADDFPFDESQLEAIRGIANQRYACLTGAAGTGKTTCTKAIVDSIKDSLGAVDMREYFKRKDDDEADVESDDDYEIPKEAIPSICLVGFTGRSTQMIKKNFPRDWHGNIMTIHRMLAYVPEFYEEWDGELESMRKKMRFIPTYTANFKLPWDVIVIDEAGMTSVDLWHNVLAACKPGCRIIMIGDINQLPPVHGRSVFGFAMTRWPSWELTHIHRQAGTNNSIVDNAWRILRGQRPISDDYKTDPSWKFAMMPIPDESGLASQKVRKWLQVMNGKAYMPHRDTVITAINGEDTSRGYPLGQLPMNRELAIVFNHDNPRFIIDAGRERRQFACGDKVMATKNDHEAGITNGMTGIITSIERNEAYAGDWTRFGEVSEVAKYMSDVDESEDEEFSLEDIEDSFAAVSAGQKAAKEAKDRGPASHTVVVEFGDGDTKFSIPFNTLSEVASLMTAYVVTCHKMQGGESPLVVIICHGSHKAMLNREWLYTAVTRASQKCVLFYTDIGLRTALSKQRIVGKNLAEKVRVFQELATTGLVGAAVNVKLPEPESLTTDLVVAPTRTMIDQTVAPGPTDQGKARLEEMLRKAKQKAAPTIVIRETHVHVHVTEVAESKPDAEPEIPEGSFDDVSPSEAPIAIESPAPLALPAPVPFLPVPQWGAYQMLQLIESAQQQLLLAFYPPPKQPSVPPVSKGFKFGVKTW